MDTPGGQVHYLACGSGMPLVLLHMTSDAATQWESVLPGFAEGGFRAIAIDIPGHGASYRPAEKPDGPENARMVVEAIDALGIGRFHLLARHFGATVGAWVAAENPDRVVTVTFNGYPMVSDEWRQRLAADEPRSFGKDGDDVREMWKFRWDMSDRELLEGARSRFSEAQARRTMIAKLQAGPNWHFAHHTVAGTDHVEMAGRIKAPTLVMAGSRDYFFEENRAAAEVFADGRFVELPGAGVDAADECPELFIETVTSFIAASA